jgi:glycosyltransferase
MKVSIITVVYNGKETIEECIKSVLSQGYPNVVEYIIIDGGSTDGTIEIIRKYEDKIAYWASEPDNGIYDAINKGIKAATGDVVGILHSDDIYADTHIIEDVIRQLGEKETDSCYGDLVYVDRNDTNKIIRHWKAGDFYKERFKKGWMPPHPTFFIKRSVYRKHGLLNTDFPLAADYELMVRLLYSA